MRRPPKASRLDPRRDDGCPHVPHTTGRCWNALRAWRPHRPSAIRHAMESRRDLAGRCSHPGPHPEERCPRFEHLPTAYLADACLRAAVSVPWTPALLQAVLPGIRGAGQPFPARHAGSVDSVLEAMGRAPPGEDLALHNTRHLDEGCIGDLMAEASPACETKRSGDLRVCIVTPRKCGPSACRSSASERSPPGREQDDQPGAQMMESAAGGNGTV
jgi:hypothetical protein